MNVALIIEFVLKLIPVITEIAMKTTKLGRYKLKGPCGTSTIGSRLRQALQKAKRAKWTLHDLNVPKVDSVNNNGRPSDSLRKSDGFRRD